MNAGLKKKKAEAISGAERSGLAEGARGGGEFRGRVGAADVWKSGKRDGLAGSLRAVSGD